MAVKDWARDGTCYYVATPMNSEDVMMIPLLVAMSLDQTTARLFDRVGRPPTDPYDNAIELSIQLVDVMRKMSTLGVVSNGGYWFDQYYHQIVEPIVDHFRCEPSRNPSNDERRSETAAARNDNDESPLGASARQFERVGRPQIRSLDQHLEILTEESDGGFWFDNYFHRMRQCYPISRNECDRDLIPA
ncbi:hypothetical protein M569_00866 [Genlisea aurea]|uniref:Uncharacterized protein n=1 Tax=Genlisea aurea TaxID=192259 RepID=S8D3F8_9LAMI|nr:hypothetical protein M569_00866 [Genlisea aurea]